MSLVDDFLTSGLDAIDATLGTAPMVCEGQTFEVVVGDSTRSYEGAMGGLAAPTSLTVTAQTADVSSYFAMLQKRCTVDGVAYRVAQISADNISLVFTLEDVNS